MRYLIILLLGVFGFQSLLATGVQNGDFEVAGFGISKAGYTIGGNGVDSQKWYQLGGVQIFGLNGNNVATLGPDTGLHYEDDFFVSQLHQFFPCSNLENGSACDISFKYSFHKNGKTSFARYSLFNTDTGKGHHEHLPETNSGTYNTITKELPGCKTNNKGVVIIFQLFEKIAGGDKSIKSQFLIDNVTSVCSFIPEIIDTAMLNTCEEILICLDENTSECENEIDLCSFFEIPLAATNVPTLSQWGLIILALLLLTMASVGIVRQRQGVLAANQLGLSVKTPLFNAQLFNKMALYSLPFIIAIVALISLYEGGFYLRNLVGTIISGLIVVYFIHFIMLSGFNPKK